MTWIGRQCDRRRPAGIFEARTIQREDRLPDGRGSVVVCFKLYHYPRLGVCGVARRRGGRRNLACADHMRVERLSYTGTCSQERRSAPRAGQSLAAESSPSHDQADCQSAAGCHPSPQSSIAATKRQDRGRSEACLRPRAGRLPIGRRFPTCPTISSQAAKILRSSSIFGSTTCRVLSGECEQHTPHSPRTL
jgi:hypothetical protein